MLFPATYMTPVNSDAFLYTTIFNIDKYSALMRRPNNALSIDISSLTAGVDIRIYGILFALFALIFVVSSVNERCRHLSGDRNSSWRLLLSLFPLNGTMFSHQFGVTRKCLMTTSGFAILIFSSMYQAKLSQQLLIPSRQPVITTTDIENMVLSGDSKLLFSSSNSANLQYVLSASPALTNAMEVNPPIYIESFSTRIAKVQTHNAIEITASHSLLSYLAGLTPALCENYVLYTFSEWTSLYNTFYVSKKHVEILESMNAVIAERMSYADEFIETFQLNEECKKHIFPVYNPSPTFLPLNLVKFSGAVVFLLTFLCLAVFILVVEIICGRGERKIVRAENRFKIHFSCDNMEEFVREINFEKYVELIREFS
jgi:hypothetical protein